MKRLKLSPLVFCACALVLLGETFTGKCVGVSDGDTISVMKAGRAVKIRLEGIDCPELRQDFGTRAKQFTSALVFGKSVQVKEYSRDRYGRMVAKVSVGGQDVSLEIIKAGLAWQYKKYSSDPVLAEAEEWARKAKQGLWSTPNPVPPWEYRRMHRRWGKSGHRKRPR
jgi:endonuclease YncB( thermonuclease family)